MAEKLHPTKDLSQDNFQVGTGLKFIDINPPIADEILDQDQVTQSFNEFPIIPYSGNSQGTSHKLVEVLYNFRSMSSTFAGILRSVKSFSLGEKLEIVQQLDTTFNIGDAREISNADKSNFAAYVKSLIFHNSDIEHFSFECSDSVDCAGQIGVEIITKSILDQKVIVIKFHKPTDYCFSKDVQIGTEVCISRKWDMKYLRKNPPLRVPVYPLEGEYKKGITRTFFFYKENGTLYGRPSDLACIWDKYNEFKLKEYTTKKVKKAFIPDMIIETSDPQPGAFFDNDLAKAQGFRNATHSFEKKFTNAGDDTINVILTNRSEAARPMEVIQLQGLQDPMKIKGYLDISRDAILSANNWPKMMLDFNAATGFSTNEFFDVFGILSVTKISERQTLLERYINNIINYCFKKHELENDLGIKFVSPVQSLLNEYRDSKRSNSELSGIKGNSSEDAAGL